MLMGKRHNLLAVLCIIFLTSLSASAAQQQTATGVAEEEPMVYRFVILGGVERPSLYASLVFKTRVVQLFTNEGWGEGAIKLVGRFEIPYNDELQNAKAVLLPECLKYLKEEAFSPTPPIRHGHREGSINGWSIGMNIPTLCKGITSLLIFSYAGYPAIAVNAANGVGWECVDCTSYSFQRGSIVRTKMTRPLGGSIAQTEDIAVFSRSTKEEGFRVLFKATCPASDESGKSGKCEEDNPETMECWEYNRSTDRWVCQDGSRHFLFYEWRLM